MNRDNVVECYLMNSSKVLAEMLYDTIEKYESRTCDNCRHCTITGDGDGFVIDCHALHKSFEDEVDFGCNRFKGIEDED